MRIASPCPTSQATIFNSKGKGDSVQPAESSAVTRKNSKIRDFKEKFKSLGFWLVFFIWADFFGKLAILSADWWLLLVWAESLIDEVDEVEAETDEVAMVLGEVGVAAGGLVAWLGEIVAAVKTFDLELGAETAWDCGDPADDPAPVAVPTDNASADIGGGDFREAVGGSADFWKIFARGGVFLTLFPVCQGLNIPATSGA